MFMNKFTINNHNTENYYAQLVRNALRYQAIDTFNNELKANDKTDLEDNIENNVENNLEDNANEKEKKLFIKETQWIEESKLNDIKIGLVQYAIYMSWDCKNNLFYVGKVKDLRTRLEQHNNDPKDSIPNFTHFRYSILNKNYWHLIYMFEMHEIHTARWILFSNAKSKYLQALHNFKCQNSVSMVNTVDNYYSPF